MKIEELKIFLHLAQSLNFFRTATDCHLAPSTLSRLIRRMEEEVGHALFLRNNKSVRLTKQGKCYVAFAQESLNAWAALQLELTRQTQTVQGPLSLYCSPTAAYSLLAGLLSGFGDQHPQVRLDLEVGSSAWSLEKARSKDLVVAALAPEADLEKLPLAQTQVVLVARKAQNWRQQSLILPRGGRVQALARAWAAGEGWQAKELEAGGVEAALTLAALGLGAAAVPRLVWDKSPLSQELTLLDTEPLGELTIYLAREGKRPSSQAQALWNWVQQSRVRA